MTIIQKGELMGDLISRQDAIDALGEKPLVWDDLSDFDLGKAAQWSDDVDAIKALPSAQPKQEQPTNIQDILEYLDTVLHPIVSPEHWNVYSELYDMISALPPAQPQSCKDAVSKADVLETYAELYDVFDDNKEIKNELHKIYDKINALQAAQPQRMKGRWIDVTKTGGAELWKCSECGELELEDSYFCPNCGAWMRGEQNGKNS